MIRLATVAVPVPFLEPLTYRVRDETHVPRGARVVVPLGRRLVTGIALEVVETADASAGGVPGTLRDIARVLDREPFLPGPVLDLALWVADYYLCTPGEALAAAMPPLARLESEGRWQLTEAGRAARAGVTGRAVHRLLQEVPADRAVGLEVLVRRASREESGDQGARAAEAARLERVLRQAEAQGLVERLDELRGRADASRTERTVRLTGHGGVFPGGDALTARQRDALDALRDLVLLEGEVAASALPAQGVTPAVLQALVRKGFVALDVRRVDRATDSADEGGAGSAFEGAPVVEPTHEQAEALSQLTAWAGQGFRVALLHGVTGSGKTEVYRRLARHVCTQGKRVLILVPEIALTPAVAARFRATFGERVAIQHSALSEGERHDQWHRIRRGDVDVVVGTRSAVFAPLGDLGLVIVDEEHDTSYKQEETPRYHGRDVAVVRARQAGALAVLGSATPSLESYQNVTQGRYALVRLTRRVLDRPLADVRVVSMRDEFAESGPEAVLSAALREALAQRLNEGEQSMILLNRRGYAANVFCRQCGDTLECPNCSVSLTVHRTAHRARCHYCDYQRRLPESCVKCGATYLEYQGVGTERVEHEVREAFPGARVARVDRDTIRRRGEITKVLRQFARREIDVLVGTQMIAKGHDFPAVTLVGVISADVGLGLADFRAGERTFQLLTQVAGRAGRGERPGEAIIQTLFPDHYSIRLAQAQDYEHFVAQETRYRQAMRHPPAVSLVALIVRGKSEHDARRDAILLADAMRGRNPALRVQGPAPAPLARLRGHHRVQIFVKSAHRLAMRQAVRDALRLYPQLARVVSVDVDPINVL
jgi:primosomal protein N' (replication factor Y)